MLTGGPPDLIPQYSNPEQVRQVPSRLLHITDVDNSFAHMPKCRIYLLMTDTLQKQTEQEHDHKNTLLCYK